MTNDRKARRGSTPQPPSDALTHIRAEHAELQQMFAAFANTRSVNNKRFLVHRICTTLVLHEQVKEEVFYPAVEQLQAQAETAHPTVKAMALRIQRLEPVADIVDGPIRVLAQKVQAHVSDLHASLFPRVAASDIDLVELGHRMARRKAELIARPA